MQICVISCRIFPINYLKLGKTKFVGDYTYYKGEKKSQIDFVFTNAAGAKHMKDFVIPSDDWHLSDHGPLIVELESCQLVNTSLLLKRALDLNYEFDPYLEKPVRHISKYNKLIFESCLKSSIQAIESDVLNELSRKNLNGALVKLDERLSNAYKMSKIMKSAAKSTDSRLMDEANKKFDDLQKCLHDETFGDRNMLLLEYQSSRNKITVILLLTNLLVFVF